MSVFVRKLALWAVRPKRNTSMRNPEHKVYPYLLRGKAIDRPNQVCVEALSEALARFGKPGIFNTDQGAQFTSDEFTEMLRDHGIEISMDGRERCHDNIFV